MNESTPQKISDSSATASNSRRGTLFPWLRWLCSWRGVRRILIVLAWIVTAVALFYGEEDWRGRHGWNRYRQALESHGAQLNFGSFIPKPVPDDQNFAASPVVKSWFTNSGNSQQGNDDFWQAEQMIPKSRERNAQDLRSFSDLVAWQMAFAAVRSGDAEPDKRFESTNLDLESRSKAAPAVLDGLKSNEALFTELRTASQRPYSRYPIVYDLDNPWGILLPHLGHFRPVCTRLSLKACAELAAGKNEDALHDVKLILFMADSVGGEPTLISYLVRLACVQIAAQPIWEGLAEHRWTEPQLQFLQTRLQHYDFVADMERSLESERAAGILTGDLLVSGKYHPNDLGGSEPEDVTYGQKGIEEGLAMLMPRGWYHLEQINYCRCYSLLLGGAFDTSKKRVFPSRLGTNLVELNRELSPGGYEAILGHRFLARLLVPSLRNIPLKAAMGQVTADEASLACALERYRLAFGHFPEQLEGLLPQFVAAQAHIDRQLPQLFSQLPADVFSGGPYKYRLKADGQFVLYSVGWNEKDDGGVLGRTLYGEQNGDWVWQYPDK